MDWAALFGVFITLVGLIFGFFKWFVGSAEKRHEQHDKRFEDVDKLFTRHADLIQENKAHLERTRDELYRDYPRNEQLQQFRVEMREDFGTVENNFREVFSKLAGVARDLNQLIGANSNGKDKEDCDGK